MLVWWVRERWRALLTLLLTQQISVCVFRCSLSGWSACANDLVGGAEDFLCALFGDRIGVETDSLIKPVLDIAATIIGTFKAQRFATQKRNGFGFYFAQISWRRFGVREVGFGGVAENDVCEFVKKRFVWKLSDGVNCYLALASKTLTVSVSLIEWDAFNAERCNCFLRIPLWNRCRVQVLVPASG